MAAGSTNEIKGLSPRVRGSPRRRTRCDPSRRSIPACAGEPLVTGGGHHEPRVYPRVCGGALGWDPEHTDEEGLSPRVRGSRFDAPHDGARRGSIPACAGEPGRTLTGLARWRVYPRVCGGASVKLLTGSRSPSRFSYQ